MMRLSLLVLVLAACRREGDHCVVGERRCNGSAILECQQASPNSKPELLRPYKSNYFESRDCPAGKTCMETSRRSADCIDPRALVYDAALGD